MVEHFTEKPGKDAMRELSKGSKYSSEAQPFEVCTLLARYQNCSKLEHFSNGIGQLVMVISRAGHVLILSILTLLVKVS